MPEPDHPDTVMKYTVEQSTTTLKQQPAVSFAQ